MKNTLILVLKTAALAVLVFAAASLATDPAWAQSIPGLGGGTSRSTRVFDEMVSVTSTAATGISTVVRWLGIASFLVIGGIWMGTGRTNFKLMFGAGAGLLVAAMAGPLVNFLLPSGAPTLN